MNFPRCTAILFLLLLIGGLSLACIGTLSLISAPPHPSSSNVEHVEGNIVQMEDRKSGMEFELETANGQLMQFQCTDLCHASSWHLERHMQEHAETDIYYIVQPDHHLIALDAD